MIRRVVSTALVFVAFAALSASPAAAAPALHGRGPRTQAAMLAEAANRSIDHAQVLDRVCENAIHERGCTRVTPALQRAFEHTVGTRIRWVSERMPHAGQFWVLGQVRFERDQAASMVAWRDPGPFGCSGWTRIDWAHRTGSWVDVGGIGVVGCAAVP